MIKAIKVLRRLKRRTHKERSGEGKRWKSNDWLKVFPRETKKAKTLAKVQPKIQEKMLKEPGAQIIGRLIEEKVSDALQNLKKKREIRDYLETGKLSYADLIEGVDFIFIYIDGIYRICRFSVTGWKWLGEKQERYPEIPILPITLEESIESIEQKIIALKNGDSKYFCQ